MMKRLAATFAALALLVGASWPAQAESLGTLPHDQDWTLEVTNSSSEATAVTVYYLGNNLDVIAVLSVPAAGFLEETLTRPGNRVKRIVIELDPPPGGHTTVSINQGTPYQSEGSAHLVLNVL
jgi:hypothetical protein